MGAPGKSHFSRIWFSRKRSIAEVQRIFLIGEDHERWRRSFRLRHVVNLHGPGLRRGPALQIDFFFEPAIEFRRGDALFAGAAT